MNDNQNPEDRDPKDQDPQDQQPQDQEPDDQGPAADGPDRTLGMDEGPEDNLGNEAPEKMTPDRGAPAEPAGPATLEQIAEEAAEVARVILSHFPKIKKPTIRWRVEDDSVWVDIEGDPSGRLIGRRGQTIDAFQHVLSKVVSHHFRKKLTVNVDAEKYKRRQREKLEKLALMTADYVARTKEARALEPMNPAERRLVHIALKNRTDILTASEGKDPTRFVVIWPNTDDEE